ncbi:MAG: lysylphosphatidylglycerol synthase transmembrane domain-containing protein [Candidatus Dojkabacteria bacterium]|nr:MAG: lysylphosphatidylglycerol synthase transmembrane domain-containing protein [Candidatus Dojkabacteria bacterium]
MQNHKRLLKLVQNILVVALFVGSIYLIAINLNLQTLIEKSGEIKFWPTLAVILLSILGSVVRGLRLRDLTLIQLPLGSMTNISIVHSYLATMLPFRLGELALPALLKKFANYSLSKAFGKLVFIRIIDTGVILIVGVLLTLVISGLGYMKVASMVTFLGILFFLAILKSDFALNIMRKIPGIRKGSGILEAVNEVTHKQYFQTLITTAAGWVITYAATYYAFQAVGLDISLTVLLVAATVLTLSAVIPIQTPGMVGTYEAIMLFVFSLFAIKGEGILEAIVLSHILSISINTVIAAVSGGILFVQGKKLDRTAVSPITLEGLQE